MTDLATAPTRISGLIVRGDRGGRGVGTSSVDWVPHQLLPSKTEQAERRCGWLRLPSPRPGGSRAIEDSDRVSARQPSIPMPMRMDHSNVAPRLSSARWPVRLVTRTISTRAGSCGLSVRRLRAIPHRAKSLGVPRRHSSMSACQSDCDGRPARPRVTFPRRSVS